MPSGEITPIDLPPGLRGAATGMTGLASYPGGYLAVLPPRTLVYLTPDFEVHKIRKVDQIRDGHSVCYYRGAAYVVSSGTDQVIRISDDGAVDVFWEASDAGCDTVHLNSVQWHHDQCLVSAFGRRKGQLWRSADEGYVFNVTTGEYVMKPLYHPHSIIFINGDMWVCESSRLAVASNCGVRVVTNWGYLRGLYESDGFLYVGSTVGRSKSKSTGALIDNQADPGLRSGRCGIGVIKLDGKNSRAMEFIDLSVYADEIYDITGINPLYLHRNEPAIRPLRTQHAVLASYAGAQPERASRLETNVPDCRFGNSRMYGSRS